VLQLLIWLQAHITAYTQAVGKHHARQFILPVRTACIAHVKLHTQINIKNTLVSNGRRVRTHNQSPRPSSESKAKPNRLLTYNRTRSPSNPCDAAEHGDILGWATLSVSKVTFCTVDSQVSSQYWPPTQENYEVAALSLSLPDSQSERQPPRIRLRKEHSRRLSSA